MASQLKVDTLTGVTTAGSIVVTGEGNSTTTNLQQGLCKAWHTIDGEGTVAIVDSFNIASITDNDTGDYSFTYTNNMGTAKHPVTGSVVGASTGNFYSFISSDGVAQATTGNTTKNVHHSGAHQDTDPTHLVIHGDLA
jgi:hypothetical protein